MKLARTIALWYLVGLFWLSVIVFVVTVAKFTYDFPPLLLPESVVVALILACLGAEHGR